MRRNIWYGLGGVLAGALAGLLLAPQSGRRTRALIRDKTIKYSHDLSDFTGKKSRHIANKARGYAHEVKDFVADKIVRRETEEVEEPV